MGHLLIGNFVLRCKTLKRPPVSDGQWPFGAGSGGQCSVHQPFRPRLKLPTQSQMVNIYILKFDILKFQFKAKLCELHGRTPAACIMVIHYTHTWSAFLSHAHCMILAPFLHALTYFCTHHTTAFWHSVFYFKMATASMKFRENIF